MPPPGTQPGDPMQQMLLQNQQLIQTLIQLNRRPQASDPLAALMANAGGEAGDQEGDSLKALTGARGCAVRDGFLAWIKQHKAELLSGFRHRLAEIMETDVERLEPAALRGFFERKSPLGQLTMLTYTAFSYAHLWEISHRGNMEEMQAAIALLACFADQTAVDAGRYHLSWLLTGLQEPPFSQVKRNTFKDRPYSRLVDPRWVAANLAFLRDLDYLETKAKSANQQRQQPTGTGDGDGDEKSARAKARAKARAAARAAAGDKAIPK